MSTTIRPELSEKNKYWIDRHRYYELKHFCLQYPMWKKIFLTYDSFSRLPEDLRVSSQTGEHGDPTVRCVEQRESLRKRMELIEQTAILTDAELGNYILRGVTCGLTYEGLKARLGIPCCRDTYYDLYRRFFWLLSQKRD